MGEPHFVYSTAGVVCSVLEKGDSFFTVSTLVLDLSSSTACGFVVKKMTPADRPESFNT